MIATIASQFAPLIRKAIVKERAISTKLITQTAKTFPQDTGFSQCFQNISEGYGDR